MQNDPKCNGFSRVSNFAVFIKVGPQNESSLNFWLEPLAATLSMRSKYQILISFFLLKNHLFEHLWSYFQIFPSNYLLHGNVTITWIRLFPDLVLKIWKAECCVSASFKKWVCIDIVPSWVQKRNLDWGTSKNMLLLHRSHTNKQVKRNNKWGSKSVHLVGFQILSTGKWSFMVVSSVWNFNLYENFYFFN